MKNSKLIGLVIVLLLAVGGGSFYAGIKYQAGKNSVNFSQGQQGAFRQRVGQNQNVRSVRGEILNVDEKSMTVKLADGSSKIVLLSGNTSINKATEGVKEDLKAGEKVAVFGNENSDGSVTAQSIQLNPISGVMP